MFEKAKPWLILGVSAWALLAFVAWHYESTCGMFLSSECWSRHWNALRNFVLFRWLYDFQTLLAGFAAIAGGAFVLLGSKLNSEETKNETDRSQRKASSIACSLIHDEFRDAVLVIQNTRYESYIRLPPGNGVQTDLIFKHLPSHIHQLHYISPTLGSLVSAAKRDFDALCTPDLRNATFDRRSHSVIQCYVMCQLLLEVERRLKADGTFPVGEEKVPAGYLADKLKRLSLNPTHLIGYYSLFEWECEPANQSS
jgi:hypothetical protein